MNISIDARELVGNRTGPGRYLAGLLQAWSSQPDVQRHSFRFYTPAPLTADDVSRLGDVIVMPGGSGTAWEQIQLARALARDKPDVHFAPAYTAPLASGCPLVVAIHDVSFVSHPEWFGAREGLRRRWLTRQTARQARAVLTDSEFSRREIVEHFGIQPAHVHAVYPGFGSLNLGRAVTRSRTPREDLVLFVGSIFNRRHVPDLIHAFAVVARRHPGVRLEIVGENRTNPFEDLARIVDGVQMNGRVRVRSYVGEDTLQDLYSRARAFVFTSDYEGFGMTPLEALAGGVPIVVKDVAIAREIYGEAARYVMNPGSEELVRALEDMLFNEESRRAVLSPAPLILERYTWERAAGRTLTLIEAARR